MFRQTMTGTWATCALMLTHPVVAATTPVTETLRRPASTPYLGITPHLPTVLNAVAFDDGGPSVAYYDRSPGNAGGAFRTGDVDVEPCSEGGYNVGWTSAGEWLRYNVNVAARGTYQLHVRVASAGRGGTLHLESDGLDLTGPLSVPDTGGWQRWQTITKTVVLDTGLQVLTLRFDTNGPTQSVGNISTLTFAMVGPYGGIPPTLPGEIRPERYDEGGDGVGYHDTTAGNAGGQFRGEGVDLEQRGSGYNVGWTADGEWLAYSVTVAQTGSYTLSADVATPLAGPAIHVEIGGASVPVPIPVTGGWQSWTRVTAPLTLTAGLHVLRVVFDVGGVNLGTMNVAAVSEPSPPPGPVQDPPAPPAPTVTFVGPTDDLQAAINAASPGDTLMLAAGVTYVGNFVLPVKPGAGLITLRSSTDDAQLPGPGVRLTPAVAPLLAKLKSPNSMPALRTAAGAHHYRLLFLEVLPNLGGYGDLVTFGDGSSAQDTLSAVPYALTIDRCFLHGDPVVGQKRGLALNSADTRVLNSYFADFKAVGMDTQAIAGWNGPGPFEIVNNYLEAAGENVLFGGADPWIPGLVPSDIVVRRNLLSRPLAWRGQNWQVKNLFELKNAQRVVVDGNVLENHWAQAQPGYAVLFTPRNQDGRAPWSIVQQVRFSNNVVRNVSAGINLLGRDTTHPSQLTNDIVIVNNLFENVSGRTFGGPGRFMLVAGGANITVDHNTVFQDGLTSLYSDAQQVTGFVFTNNIVPDYSWAVMGVNSSPGNGTIAAYFPNARFLGGIFAGSNPARYPAGNYYPASLAAVGFVDLEGQRYRLSSASLYRDSATDGADVGCDIDLLNAAAGTTY